MTCDYAGTRVLVTGAGGFIGSHLTEELVRRGAKVRAFVHYNALDSLGWIDESELRSEMEIVTGDIRDADSVSTAMQGVEIIFHLAALIGIPYSYVAPGAYVQTNVVGTLNVLQAARTAGTKRVILTSTSEVYGTARTELIGENHPLQGQSPYSATKISADKLGESFHLSFGLPVVTVRPFNTYGPRQSARAVIPTIISQCLTSDVVRLGSLTPTRDLNFVSDTVDGFVRAGLVGGVEGCVINLGSGKEISIGLLAETIISIIGKPIRIVEEDRRRRPEKSEVFRLIADRRSAESLLRWTPQVDLRNGLERTIDWFGRHIGRYHPNQYSL